MIDQRVAYAEHISQGGIAIEILLNNITSISDYRSDIRNDGGRRLGAFEQAAVLRYWFDVFLSADRSQTKGSAGSRQNCSEGEYFHVLDLVGFWFKSFNEW